jgi:hypothetical protein
MAGKNPRLAAGLAGFVASVAANRPNPAIALDKPSKVHAT